MRAEAWRHPLRDFEAFAASHGGSAALEVFSGSGRLSQAWRRQMTSRGIVVFELDIRREAASDLTLRRVQKTVRRWVTRGLVAALWLGTPCTSFSRARERGPGGAIRSQLFPCGLPEVSQKDKEKIRVGNILVRFSTSIFEEARRRGIPVALENPWTSRLWMMPGIQRLLKLKDVRWRKLDFCAYRMPWQKRTGLMYANVDLSPACVCCTGRGVCSFTNRPHVILKGCDEQGRVRTLVAEPYPRPLCNVLATCFVNALTAHAVDKLLTAVGQ